MNLNIEHIDDVSVIRIQDSRLDTSKAPQLKKEFLDLINEGKKNLIVNLNEVEFIDSSGLGALLFGQRQASSIKGDLKIACPQQRVLMLIKIARLNRIFDIFKDEKGAIKGYTESKDPEI